MNSQCQPNMQIHIISRFTTHRADVEFSRVVAYTNIPAGGPPGRNVVETYMVTICAQCIKLHVIGTNLYQSNAGVVDNSHIFVISRCVILLVVLNIVTLLLMVAMVLIRYYDYQMGTQM